MMEHLEKISLGIAGAAFMWSMYKIDKDYKNMLLREKGMGGTISWLQYHLELEHVARLKEKGCSEEEIRDSVEILLNTIYDELTELRVKK